MADVYVDTDVSPGGSGTSGDPYASLNEAWEAEDANIAAGETWNFFCAGSTVDSAAVVVDGVFALASGVTINVYPWHTDFGASSDKPDGYYSGVAEHSSSHYSHSITAGTDGIYVNFGASGTNSNTVKFEAIQIDNHAAAAGSRAIGAYNGNTNDTLNVIACRLKHSGTYSVPRGVRTDGNCFATCNVINCLMYYGGTELMSWFNINKNHSQTFRFINNTCINASTGGEDTIDDAGTSNIVRAINNAIFHSVPTTTDVELDLQASTKTVLTNATPVSGDRGGGTDIVSGDFNSYSTDFRPAASQTNAWGTGGTTNGTNSNVPTTDILGDPRNTSGNTAIGCFAIIAGEGASGVTGTGAISSSVPTLSATGTIARDGTGAATLPVATLSGTGVREITSSGGVTAPVATLDGSGTVGAVVTGSGAATLPVATLDGTGLREITGTGSATLPSVTISGTGLREVTGSGGVTAPVATLDGTGEIAGAVSGSGAITAPAVTASGTGVREITGSGGVTSPVPTLDGTGELSGIVGGSGGVTAPTVTISGAGTIARDGTGAITAPIVTLSGTGTVEELQPGSGAVVIPLPSLSGTGVRASVGSGAATLPVAVLAGTGIRTSVGSGAITLPVVTLYGVQVVGGIRSEVVGAGKPSSTLNASANNGTLTGSLEAS